MGGLADKLRTRCCGAASEKSEKLPQNESVSEEETGRAQWASPTEFLLTCIGYSVGLGNVWRFPYLCYKSGGGAFLIPYMIMILLIGMPLLFMEYAFGQFFGIGSLSIFKKVCPLFQGIGMGYVIVNALVCIYYNVIIALTLYYLFASFTAELPWATCGHEWNTPMCGDPNDNFTLTNVTDSLSSLNSTVGYNLTSMFNTTVEMNRTSPSDEYFRLAVMDVTPEHSVENLGEVRWKLCLCLLLAWILVVLFVSRGIKSTGKVAYFTATFPYVMLTVLVVRGVTLPGAGQGILYFVKPDWEKLRSPEVWYAAATQLFYSTNLAWGGMITMASYNNKSHNCFRDAIMINIVSFFTSLYAGFAVFSIIGYMANEYGLSIEKVIDSGPGLAFIVYPRALSLMPLAQLWSALFFFMLFLLGIGSQMVLIETVVTGFVDEYPQLGLNPKIRFLTTVTVAVFFCVLGIPSTTQMVQAETILTGIVDNWNFLGRNWKIRLLTVFGVCFIGFVSGIACTTQMVDMETVMSGICDEFPNLRKRRFIVLLMVAATFFLLGIPQVTQGGMYVLQLMDWYSAGFNVLLIAVTECIVINCIYGNTFSSFMEFLRGHSRFASDVKSMRGRYPELWWRLCWRFISPLLIFGILIFSFVKYSPAKYGEKLYPAWADAVGWILAVGSICPILIVALYKFITAPGNTGREKLYNVTRPVIFTDPRKIKSTIEVVEKRELNPGDYDPDADDAEAQKMLSTTENDVHEKDGYITSVANNHTSPV